MAKMRQATVVAIVPMLTIQTTVMRDTIRPTKAVQNRPEKNMGRR